MWFIFLLVSLLASIVGAICGIGGGVLIKPILDATGVMGVREISFLSGCTVLSMSLISVGKSLRRGDKNIELKQGTALAVGAAIGGIVGKELFQYACAMLPDTDRVGAIQAAALLAVTALTMGYTLAGDRVRTYHIDNLPVSILIGLFLGILSSFLGIGGGPINLMVLGWLFSMDMKKAAANSLYIILFSQLTSLGSTLLTRSVPEVELLYLVLMVGGGVAGGMIGGRINKGISEKQVQRLFVALMVVIMAINVYNVVRFVG